MRWDYAASHSKWTSKKINKPKDLTEFGREFDSNKDESKWQIIQADIDIEWLKTTQSNPTRSTSISSW